ncbi:O-antigen ligase family protein [Thomasclavelia spiroformis]|uniref:O-antigen ligase family protein n=1 Tax=Thomasclavelia spiroformis TaxID=29348 RepID=UPI0024B1B78F|nr:O-antigen ligase family protein [Thomasclavelia spiroformis]
MIKVTKNKFASWLLILLLFLTPISIYLKLELELVIFFLFLSLPYWMNLIFRKNLNEDNNLNIFNLWIVYIGISLISTLIFQHHNIDSFRGIFYEISLTIAIYPIAALCDKKYFFITFRNLIFILGILSLISQLIKWDPFFSLRARAMLTGIDTTSGGGISSLFEYRHYYAMFLVFSLLITYYYPSKKSELINVIFIVVLLINLAMTYTRNAWIAFILLVFIILLKNKNNIHIFFKIKIKNLLLLLYTILILLLVVILFKSQLQQILNNIMFRFQQVKSDNELYGNASGVRGYVVTEGIKYICENWQKYLWIGGGNGFALQWLKNNPYGITTIRWVAAIDVQYVTTIMNSGILGIILLLLILIRNIEFFITQRNNLIFLIFIGYFIMFWFFDVIPFMSSVFVFWIIAICFESN